MAKPKDSIAINGAKYFTFQKPSGEWTDPLQRQAIFSRTFIPIGTPYKMTDDRATMLNIIRTDKVPLKEVNLSEETKKELNKAKIVYEKIGDITPIEPLPKIVR